MTPLVRSESAPEIILASASPRRRELLTVLGVPFRVVVADIDEQPRPGEAPEALVERLARSKALTVDAREAAAPGGQGGQGAAERDRPERDRPERDRPERIVLAADTVVVLDGAILNKPADAVEARTMLSALRGRPHRVLTGLALARGGEVAWSSVAETVVTMRAYADDEVTAYIASGRPLDKAGAYGIQDADFRPVERIDGCYTNVVGLPLCEVRRALAGSQESRARSREGCELCEAARAPQPTGGVE